MRWALSTRVVHWALEGLRAEADLEVRQTTARVRARAKQKLPSDKD